MLVIIIPVSQTSDLHSLRIHRDLHRDEMKNPTEASCRADCTLEHPQSSPLLSVVTKCGILQYTLPCRTNSW